MKNTKSTKRALLSAILALVMTVSMLVGTTFAWFTDSVTSSGNKIVAGNLDVELHMFNASSGAYEDISNKAEPIFGEGGLVDTQEDVSTIWEPGKTQVVYLAIKNAGNLALKYRVVLDVTSITKKLDDVVTYTITPDAKAGDVTAWNGANANSIVAGEQVVSASNVALEAGAIHYFALSVHMDELAGNEYMNGTITFDLSVLAAQLAYEGDSFGNSFDGGAGYQPNTSNPAVLPDDPSDAEDIIVESSSGMTVTVSPEVYENMDDTTESFTLSHGDIVVNPAEGTVTVKKADLLDQNSEVIDLTGNTEPIPVTIPVGNAFTAGESVLVYHDGVLVDDAIVAADGTISYTAYHFCDIVIARPGDYVAYVGTKLYKSLSEAVNAAVDGDTVVLVSDIIFDENTRTHNSGSWYDGIYYVGDESFTLDLNGYEISQDGSVNDYLLNFKNVGTKANTITIKNGVVDAGTTAFCALCTSSSQENQLTINLENVELYNNMSNGSTAKIRGGTILNVKDGAVITGKTCYSGIECVASTVNIYDGAELYTNSTSGTFGFLAGSCYGGTINVYGGYGKGARGGFVAMTSGGTVNVYGGEWIANVDGSIGDNSNLYVLTSQNNKDESGYVGASIINVYGGTFRGGMDAWIIKAGRGEVAELNIFGGNFNADPSTYVENGFAGVLNDGLYDVVDVTVAKIGNVRYTSLQAAIDAAKAGDVIVINQYTELTAQSIQELMKPVYNRESYSGIIIPDDKAITIDLNGQTVYYEDAYGDIDNVMVLNLGILTINDSVGGGKLSYKPVASTSSYAKFYSTVFNCGTLTVNGGTIENICETDYDVTNAVDNHSRLSHEYGNDCILIVNGGTLTGASYYSVRQYTHYLEGVKNRVIVNGGTFNNGIYMQHGESWYYPNPETKRLNVDMQLTINGGEFFGLYEGSGSVVARVSNPDNKAFAIEINDGIFHTPIKLRVQRGVTYANGVSGATIPAEATGARNEEWLAANGGFVHGGTFYDIGDADDVTTNLASFVKGILTDNGDGTYSVEPIFVEVANVDELMAALKDGAYIRITESISGATIKLPASLTKVFITAAEGVVIENSTIMASDGNSIFYDGLTFDGLTFVNSRISLTGWRTNGATIKNLTVNGCVFKDLNDSTNSAPLHINMDATEAVENFTFTNNVIDGATGGSKSGVYAQVTGKVIFANNIINNVSFRPYVIQITSNDGINDEFIVTGNTFSGSAAGRAQGLSNSAEGTDKVKLVVSGNIFKDITSAQQICYWNFNPETTTADLSGNYFDIDITSAENLAKIYYNKPASSVEDLVAFGVYPFYTELNADGTINADSLVVAP